MAKGDNECIAFFDAGDDITVHAEAAITGKRFIKISDPQQGPLQAGLSTTSEGSNIVCSPCGAGEKPFGVAAYDTPIGDKTYAVRGNKCVPVTAGAAITAGQPVTSDATGRAIPFVMPASSGNAETLAIPVICGVAVDDASGAGVDCPIVLSL